MSRGLTLEQMEFLVSKGVTADEMLAFAKMGGGRSKGAERTARWRANKVKNVTKGVTRDVTSDASHPPIEDHTPHSVPDGTGGKPPADPVKGLIDDAVAILRSQGHAEKQARSIIGSWRKGGERDGEIIAALVEARQRSISNLVEWMPKRLNGSRSTDPPKLSAVLMEEKRRREATAH
jgi:hypothetical protein